MRKNCSSDREKLLKFEAESQEFGIFFEITKGQLISKTNCQAMDSSKKRTNEFVFTSMRRVFVCFLEESLGLKICFRNYLTFSRIVKFDNCESRFRLNLKTATLTSKRESVLAGGS